jgi:hypothetical protein
MVSIVKYEEPLGLSNKKVLPVRFSPIDPDPYNSVCV